MESVVWSRLYGVSCVVHPIAGLFGGKMFSPISGTCEFCIKDFDGLRFLYYPQLTACTGLGHVTMSLGTRLECKVLHVHVGDL